MYQPHDRYLFIVAGTEDGIPREYEQRGADTWTLYVPRPASWDVQARNASAQADLLNEIARERGQRGDWTAFYAGANWIPISPAP